MIYNQPNQQILYDSNVHSFDIRIRSIFKSFQSTFVILNPFFKGGTLLNWNTVMSFSEHFSNLNIISRNVGFYNFTIYEADINEWKNFEKLIRSNKIEPPASEQLNKELFDNILKEIKSLGYESLKKDYMGEETIINPDSVTASDETLIADAKILTLDDKFCLAQDFDQITTFFSGPKEEIERIVNKIDLEGFFADDTLTLLWDIIEIEGSRKIERDKVNIELN